MALPPPFPLSCLRILFHFWHVLHILRGRQLCLSSCSCFSSFSRAVCCFCLCFRLQIVRQLNRINFYRQAKSGRAGAGVGAAAGAGSAVNWLKYIKNILSRLKHKSIPICRVPAWQAVKKAREGNGNKLRITFICNACSQEPSALPAHPCIPS